MSLVSFMLWYYFNQMTFFFFFFSLQTLAATHMDDKELTESIQKLLIVMQRLDHKIAPLMESDGELFNGRWCGACSWNFCLAWSLCLCLLGKPGHASSWGHMCLLFQNLKLGLKQCFIFFQVGFSFPSRPVGQKPLNEANWEVCGPISHLCIVVKRC